MRREHLDPVVATVRNEQEALEEEEENSRWEKGRFVVLKEKMPRKKLVEEVNWPHANAPIEFLRLISL